MVLLIIWMQPLESAEDRKKHKVSEHWESYMDDNGAEGPSAEEGYRQVSSKKKEKEWPEKQSRMSKLMINNRRQEKLTEQAEGGYQGIFLYKPGVELPSLFHFANQYIKVIIASEYMKRDNPEYLKRNLYGSETYTSNSDCFCIGVHSGYINLNTFANKKYEGIEITFKVIKPKKNYNGATKNGMTSRTIKGYNGNALKPESYRFLNNLESIENLERYASNMHIPIGKSRRRPKPKNILNKIPIPETHLVFNMNNEPAYKYSIFNLADKGFEKNEFLVRKLDSHVLYLESNKKEKYELTKIVVNHEFEVYQFAKVLDPYNCDNLYFSSNCAPLNPVQIEVLAQGLDWEDISWGNTEVKVKQKTYTGIISFKYYKRNCK